jgi:RNA polymerase sigma-70 factor (ECF subfamily)
MRRFRDVERGRATITDFFERRRNIEAWKDGASILGEIEVGRNLTTCQYGLNEVFLSVIVSKHGHRRLSQRSNAGFAIVFIGRTWIVPIKPHPKMTPAFPAGDMPKTGAGFQTTHWTVVLTAAQGDDGAARDALASLCSVYWYPLYAFCRRQGLQPHDAEDSTQEFFARMLEKKGLASVRPEYGRFRSFLLASLKNFLANERERAHAQRRGGGQPVISLDGANPETRYALEPADALTPEKEFERRWAFAVLGRTIDRLRRDYVAEEKGELFEQLQGFLPGGHGTVSKEELATKRGVSLGAIDVAIYRMRQRFGALLREEVLQTVSSPEEVKEEIRYLIAVLSGVRT